MPDVANLAGAMVFIVRNAMRVTDGLRTECEHRQAQRQDQEPYGYPSSHGPRCDSSSAATLTASAGSLKLSLTPDKRHYR